MLKTLEQLTANYENSEKTMPALSALNAEICEAINPAGFQLEEAMHELNLDPSNTEKANAVTALFNEYSGLRNLYNTVSWALIALNH